LTWRIADHLKMQVWDGQMVVYDHYSGDTHCLDPMVTCVLGAIVAAPGSSEDLAGRLTGTLGDTHESRVEAVRLALEELERMRLIKES
jgi:PqqD family protein of HPr-rel-A system